VNKVYADPETIFRNTWNASYGNKLTHVLFLINLCDRHGRLAVIYPGSVLDQVFESCGVLVEDPQAAATVSLAYDEGQPFAKSGALLSLLGLDKRIPQRSLVKVLHNYFRLHLEQTALLARGSFPDADDVLIRGFFFDYELMPSLETFSRAMRPRRDLVSYIERKYPTLTHERSVAVHLRGTDFQHHLREIFPAGIALDDHYYREATREIEAVMGADLEYHLFSDDMPRLLRLFDGKRCVPHDDKAPVDWVALFLARNVIQSNSSFCWTASLYNKDVSVQPAGGYNYHCGVGSVPYGFAHPNSILVRSLGGEGETSRQFPAAGFTAPGFIDVIGRSSGLVMGAAGRFLRRVSGS
jgi:hypothetical protein